jgi:hypothetical protein
MRPGQSPRVRWRVPLGQHAQIIRSCMALSAVSPAEVGAQLGGYVRVLQNFSITQCDVDCKLAAAGRGWSRSALNGRTDASATCVFLFRLVRGAGDQAQHLRPI